MAKIASPRQGQGSVSGVNGLKGSLGHHTQTQTANSLPSPSHTMGLKGSGTSSSAASKPKLPNIGIGQHNHPNQK